MALWSDKGTLKVTNGKSEKRLGCCGSSLKAIKMYQKISLTVTHTTIKGYKGLSYKLQNSDQCRIMVTSLKQHDGQTELRLEINDMEVGRMEIPEDQGNIWKNVKVYAASPWHDW